MLFILIQADAKDIFGVMASCEEFVPNNADNNNGVWLL